MVDKFNAAIKNTNFLKLDKNDQEFIKRFSVDFHLTFQEIRNIITIANDLKIWDEGKIVEFIYIRDGIEDKKQLKKVILKELKQRYESLKKRPNSYKEFNPKKSYHYKNIKTEVTSKEKLGLGDCPVASEKTRCCNLLTLDAVESCGFDCSYCSIQSFYNQNRVVFNKNFPEKLKEIKLDPKKRYHVGTGQSSDSLMWGNKEGILDALFDFARENKNVLLEFKTKSNNIKYLLENEVPQNIVCTWSLNTPTIIENEEHLTARLQDRLKAARRVADKGVKVGFHFHPIVEYDGYLKEYNKLFRMVLESFRPSEVIMVSFGTLTYIKPVLKALRARDFKSKIYQMPLQDVEGKFSYPIETKIEMFKNAYEAFKPWHKEVFFYLCMEPHSLWKECFGYEYKDNNEFEKDMIDKYFKKVGLC